MRTRDSECRLLIRVSLRDRSKTIVVGIYAIIFGAGENYLVMRPGPYGPGWWSLCDVSANAILSTTATGLLGSLRQALSMRFTRATAATTTTTKTYIYCRIPDPPADRQICLVHVQLHRSRRVYVFLPQAPWKIAALESHTQERERNRSRNNAMRVGEKAIKSRQRARNMAS